MPLYLSIGVSEERVLDGTPEDLKPFLEAYNLRRIEADEQAWIHNQYTMIAVSVAVSRVLVGNKAKGKYPNKPFLQDKETREQESQGFTDAERFGAWAIAYNIDHEKK